MRIDKLVTELEKAAKVLHDKYKLDYYGMISDEAANVIETLFSERRLLNTDQSSIAKRTIDVDVLQAEIEKLNEKYDNPAHKVIISEIQATIDIFVDSMKNYNSGWIPCSERLPKPFPSGAVLVCLKNGCICMAMSFSSGEFKEISTLGVREFCKDNPVVAWQELPKSYHEI